MRLHAARVATLSLTTLVGGSMACASGTPGARPLDMSSANHEAAAKSQDEEAAAHASVYDAKAATSRKHCGQDVAKATDGPCWTSTVNPTAQHLKDAEQHLKMAADHRAASKALRDAEQTACVGLADAERDESPFVHREDIVSATPLDVSVASGKGSVRKLTGATVVVRAVPGLTKEYLQRVVDCHLAGNAAMGFGMPDMAFCPLSVKGAHATVVSAGTGLSVEIRADDTDAVTEVLKRSRALVPGT